MMVWAQCDANAANNGLPVGCDCRGKWTSSDCDDPNVQNMGCPAAPCDFATNNEPDSWCYLVKQKNCPLWAEDGFSGFAGKGGAIYECDGTCLVGDATDGGNVRVDADGYAAAASKPITNCEDNLEYCSSSGSGVLEMMPMMRESYTFADDFPAGATMGQCVLSQWACKCKSEWSQDGYVECENIQGCGGAACWGGTEDEEWCEVNNVAQCAAMDNNSAGLMIWSYCADDQGNSSLPAGCSCESTWMSDDCDAGGDVAVSGCPAAPCDAVNNLEVTPWCYIAMDAGCPLWQSPERMADWVGGHDRDCMVMENPVTPAGPVTPTPKPKPTRKPKGTKGPKPTKMPKPKPKGKGVKDCTKLAFESRSCILDANDGVWRARDMNDARFVPPACEAVILAADDDASIIGTPPDNCNFGVDHKGKCKKGGKGAKDARRNAFKMDCKAAGLGCKAKGHWCKYDMKAAGDQFKNQMANLAKRTDRQQARLARAGAEAARLAPAADGAL